MDPATAVLHYAQEIFEGLKAYRTADGGVTLFRPDANAARFRASARADGDAAAAGASCSSTRCAADQDRPGLGARPTRTAASTCARSCSPARSSSASGRRSEYLYVLIASPVGPYFKGGVKPVTVWVSPDYTRAAPGGTGAAKCGGNYAACLVAQAEAIEHGCDQVVFLDAVRAPLRRRAGRHERLLRLRRRHAGHPAADRHDPAGHHPRLGHHAGPAVRAHGSVERPVTFDEWRPTPPAAGSARCSPAAPPR